MSACLVIEKNINKEIETSPVLKWAGGKRQLINELTSRMPDTYGRYFEPFIGGGALFFHLKPDNAYISDINPELINVYQVIRNNVDELIENLKSHKNDKDYFFEIRNIDRTPEYSKWSNVEKASRLIFLNRTCFNGLYRVNSKGQFNVPFGGYSNPRILDENNLRNCSKVFQNTQIENTDFSKILDLVTKDDFVYFDPPYLPVNKTSSFTSYSKEGFGVEMQYKLKEVCDELTKKGVRFMLSNSHTEIILDLYKDYNLDVVMASRAINSVASKRGKIQEVIYTNY